MQDSSGILSDASLVYETEMVDQGGTVYLKQSAFIPELKTNFISAKDFQDRVRIFPTDAQINIPDKLQQYVELIYDGDDNKYNLAYPGVLDFISNKLGFKSKTVKTPVITQEFIPPLLQQTPIVITDAAFLSGGVPVSSLGSIGDYAVNAIHISDSPSKTSDKQFFYKIDNNNWASLGSADWLDNWATVTSSVSNPTFYVRSRLK